MRGRCYHGWQNSWSSIGCFLYEKCSRLLICAPPVSLEKCSSFFKRWWQQTTHSIYYFILPWSVTGHKCLHPGLIPDSEPILLHFNTRRTCPLLLSRVRATPPLFCLHGPLHDLTHGHGLTQLLHYITHPLLESGSAMVPLFGPQGLFPSLALARVSSHVRASLSKPFNSTLIKS